MLRQDQAFAFQRWGKRETGKRSVDLENSPYQRISLDCQSGMKGATAAAFRIQNPEAVSLPLRNPGESAGVLLADGPLGTRPDSAFIDGAFLLERHRSEAPFRAISLVRHNRCGIGKQFYVEGAVPKVREQARS
jgi:hypothetical protein